MRLSCLRICGLFEDFLARDWNNNFRLMFRYHMFMLPMVKCECSFAKVSSLLSSLNFLMDANTTFGDIPTYSMLDFCQTKPTKSRETRRKSAMCPPSWKSQVS